MRNLLKIAEEFEDLTEGGGRIVRNNDETLKEISSLEDFEDRIDLAQEQGDWEKLGEGSSRTIFQISDSLVLKIAHNEKGIQQNLAEMKMHSPCLNNVLVADTEGKWVIVRWTETATEDDFEEIVGVSFKTFGKALYYSFNNEVHEGKPANYDNITKHPLYKCLAKLVLDNQLQIGDAIKISSWGILDGKILLRDFGLTKDVYSEYYEDDSDNNTATI